MKVWMEITRDKYQLPIAVASSRKELAQITGKNPCFISSHIGHFNRGRLKKQRYICVEVDEEEE